MKILFAYDGSECAERALDDLQRAGLPTETQVQALAVIEHWLPPPSALEVVEHLDYNQEYQALAQRVAVRLRSLHPSWQVEAKVAAGSPATAIIEEAETWGADLIVVGSHGRSALGRAFFGSVSQKVLHEAKGPVRVARGRLEAAATPVRLIVGVDGSQCADAAVAAITNRQWPAGTEVRVINAAWTLPPSMPAPAFGPVTQWMLAERARISTAVGKAVAQLKAAGLQAEAIVKEEDPKRLLCNEAEAWGADCIFVGAHGTNRVERFLIGSVSSAVAARAHCSVEVVR